jgi:hypothetical protein
MENYKYLVFNPVFIHYKVIITHIRDDYEKNFTIKDNVEKIRKILKKLKTKTKVY